MAFTSQVEKLVHKPACLGTAPPRPAVGNERAFNFPLCLSNPLHRRQSPRLKVSIYVMSSCTAPQHCTGSTQPSLGGDKGDKGGVNIPGLTVLFLL